jgi:hypothetical protein
VISVRTCDCDGRRHTACCFLYLATYLEGAPPGDLHPDLFAIREKVARNLRVMAKTPEEPRYQALLNFLPLVLYRL